MLNVIYEDNHLIAVVKPAGLLTQGDKTGDESLLEQVREYLKNKYKKPGNVFVGLVHRLDRNVSGIVLFAKTSKGASRLSEQIRNHEVDKIYTATVEGIVSPTKGKLEHYLDKDEGLNKVQISDKPIQGYKKVVLEFEVLSQFTIHNTPVTSLKIHLETGRSHQIRAQLAHIGHPILGDIKYGSNKKLPDNRIDLTASELTFKTATGDKEIKLKLEN